MVRTILIFPEFENMAVIDGLRDRYDPLARLIRPHITLVFPFESPVSNDALARLLDMYLADVHPFSLGLQGLRGQGDVFGNALMLDVTEGADVLRRMHDTFYRHEFREFDAGIPYAPHLTVGNFGTPEALEEAFAAVGALPDVFTAVIDRVSVEMIGPCGKSIVIQEHRLL